MPCIKTTNRFVVLVESTIATGTASYKHTYAHLHRTIRTRPASAPHRVASALVYQVTRAEPYLGSSKLTRG